MSRGCSPPRDYIPMGDDYSRRRYWQSSKGQLIQMQEIWTRVAHDCAEIVLRCVEVLLAFLHPVKAKSGGIVLQPVQTIHPCGLMGKWNFPKTDSVTWAPWVTRPETSSRE